MDYELIFWIVAGIASLITICVLWVLSKRESEKYIDWMVK